MHGGGEEVEFWPSDGHWLSPHPSGLPDASDASDASDLFRPPPRRGRAWFALIVGVAATLALAGIGVVVLNMDERASADGDVIRRPVDTAGANPFMPPLGHDLPQARASQPLEPLDGDVPGGSASSRLVHADVPGRYAGTRDTAQCSKELLVDYLDSNPVVAEAWTQVLGIDAAGFGPYVDTLTPVALRYDTLVTDHTLANGAAAPSVAVLEAGTAVLVDGNGLPVTRCFTGNPLTPPTLGAAGAAAPDVTYSGPEWVGFSPDSAVRVDPAPQTVPTFVLTDVTSGELFSRPSGTTGADDRDFLPVSEADFLTTTYDVGCGEPGGPVAVQVTDGKGTVAVGGSTFHLDVIDVVRADLTGDGSVEAAVLLTCNPEGAGYVVTEVQVFRDGPALLTTLTPPAQRPPLVLPFLTGDTFEVTDGGLRASARYYDIGAGDTLVSGPSVETIVTWVWDGTHFTSDLGRTSTSVPSGIPPSGIPSVTPNPTAPTTPGAGDCLDSDLVGNWQGALTRRDGATPVRYQSTIALSEGCAGDVVGSTYYLELDCGGTLTLVSGGDEPVLAERAATSGGSCAAESELRITLSGGDLDVAYAEPSGPSPYATGTLQHG